MRIALVSTFLPADTRGGAEAYVELVARSLAERHEDVVMTASTGSIADISTVHLPGLPMLSHTRSAPVRVLWHALDQWLPTVHVSLSRELRRFAPDVVATHQPQGLSAAVFTAITARGLPHVHTAHDLNVLCARTSMTRNGAYCGGACISCRIQRSVRGSAIRPSLSYLIAVSKYICDRHVRAGIVPPERAKTIRLGAPDGPSRVRMLADMEPKLGFIGSLSPHKGIRTLLRAVEGTEEPWRLLVAGSGPLEPEVAAAARRDPRIEYVGYVNGAAKDSFFDRLDLLVIPSEWEEPSTFVVVEGALRGLPAVVSDRGGLPETPEAVTFRAGNAEELTRAIRSFTVAPSRIEEASRRLLERQTEFKWSTHFGKVEAVLEDAATGL